MNTPHLTLCELGDASASGLESYSPFCLKVHRALRASGLTYERRHGAAPSDFKAWNPAGQVPVLLLRAPGASDADAEAVADSTRIVARIESLAGPIGGPRDPRAQAEAWLWEELADTALNGFLVAARWADDRNWGRVREAYFGGAPWPVRKLIAPRVRARVVGSLHARDVWRGGADACWERFLGLLDRLEARAPRNGFWVDERLSVADVALFGQLRSFQTELTAWQSQAVTNHARLAGWLARVDAATRVTVAASAQASAAVPVVNGSVATRDSRFGGSIAAAG